MKRALKIAGVLLGLLLAAALVVPYVNADRYGKRLKWSLERSLGRQVDIGHVRFSLLEGPAFSVERDDGPGIVIHEDPSLGIEPIAYVETMVVRPQLLPLLAGRFQIASIRLEDASINLTKSGAASEAGQWNFMSFVNRSVMSSAPAIHVRNGRVNFKFGDTKSLVYLTETDLDISPPGSLGGGWSVYCSGHPARTDRSGHGLGSFTLRGRWFVAPERVDLDLTLDRTGLGEWTALFRGETGAIHGAISARLHLGGPIHNIGIQGRLNVEDIHRWDLLPPSGQGWPLDIRGRLDLTAQQIELQSNSATNEVLPLLVRFRATDYLSKPHWAAAINWNRFPVAPLMDLAAHMGAQFPPRLKLTGTMDGAIVYSGEGGFQGELGFHDTALTIPDSPLVRFERAYIVLDHGHARLSPALVRTAADDQADIEADYEFDSNTLDLAIHAEAMAVASLRAQVALAAVPWLEQIRTGQWSGDLHYHYETAKSGWTGRLSISDAQIEVPGLADPVQFASARAQIDGARVAIDHIDAEAGKVAFTGDYRYEPAAARPHRLHLRVEELDAADLEHELMPTLRRNRGLIARALGRTSLPEWLKDRGVEGSLQIGDFILDGSHLANVRANLRWDVARVELDGIQARLDRAFIAGKLTIGLRGTQPTYKLSGKVKGMSWQSGKLDAEGTLETSGTGDQLLANLKSEATFTASALDIGVTPPWRAVTGSCNLAWSPRLRVTGLNVKTEDETYTGRGATQDDGRLVIQLSSGSREMRISGTPARLKVEEAARQ
jgi:hypothetical protein